MQAGFETNRQIMEALLQEGFLNIKDKLTSLGGNNLYYIVVEDNKTADEKNFFLQNFRNYFDRYQFRLVYTQPSDTPSYIIEISDIKLKTSYKKFYTEGIIKDKFLEREIGVDFNIAIKQGTEVKYKDRFYKRKNIPLSADVISQAEDENLKFTKGTVPDEPFLNKIIVPVIVAAASAAAIILFFLVRSK